MWVARHWKSCLVGAFLALLGASVGSYYLGKREGNKEGLTNYHLMCYTGGPGFVIIDGKVVLCGPGGQLSEHEQKELDSRVKV